MNSRAELMCHVCSRRSPILIRRGSARKKILSDGMAGAYLLTPCTILRTSSDAHSPNEKKRKRKEKKSKEKPINFTQTNQGYSVRIRSTVPYLIPYL